jgi:hypothetical protein
MIYKVDKQSTFDIIGCCQRQDLPTERIPPMFDTLEIGSTPCDEACQQVGTKDYDPHKARLECQRFRTQLRQQFGEEPEGAKLIIKGNPHDFGTYYEVACKYEMGNEKAEEYAFNCESEAWPQWRDTPVEG